LTEQSLVFVLFLAFSVVQALIRAWKKQRAAEVERGEAAPPVAPAPVEQVPTIHTERPRWSPYEQAEPRIEAPAPPEFQTPAPPAIPALRPPPELAPHVARRADVAAVPALAPFVAVATCPAAIAAPPTAAKRARPRTDQRLGGARWRKHLAANDPAGLRRAFALSVILGPPRALDPPN
jgi:hypothetical protein